ncbi:MULTISPECIES: hypothetical protein [Pedobacter]|uniref:Uncharacterized protein n=1 Tax=Pedobacter boryungensis TaxID=869962 RepID=A0ABX2DGF4_9SPHI|nr:MULTISPECIES: hypothetical protein [Pedobacter]NQX32857.1 hypothetical protein [Pedobacter boryungensis]
MEKLQASQILVPGAEIKAIRLKQSKAVKDAIAATIKLQEEILKLKDVDQETLKLVVQL